jgi:hypothetical protein
MKTVHPGILYTPPCGGVAGGFPPLRGLGGSSSPDGGLGESGFPDGGLGVKPLKEKFPCKCIL